MKSGWLFFSLLLLSPSFLMAGDSAFVLVQVHGLTERSASFNKGHFLEKQLISNLKKDLKKMPVRFFTVEDSAASPVFNFSLVLNVLELNIDEPIINQVLKTISNEINANNYRDEAEDLKKQHAVVSADITILEKTVTAFLRITVSTIQLPQVSTLSENVFTDSYKWENKSATYTGSFQALGYKEVELVRNKEKPVPEPQAVFETLIKQWANKYSAKIAGSLQH